ncbi:hypothetical protein [Aliarcobacter butzleri]|uniref:hypothetical protein n=1 Tax=Aliarcobacter butzleri TaxID=28197 RepID=UPI00125EED86|nr:hypothetical protein [Aliarcobacter butzleri]MCT7644404.1 hypothetical protein [Aliarcobacter butzleri]
MCNLTICESITKLKNIGIEKALKEFADYDESTRNIILKEKKEIFRELKKIHKDIDDVTLDQSAIVISIRKYINSISPERLRIQKRKKKFSKKNNKEEWLREHWAIIREAKLVYAFSFTELTIHVNVDLNFQVSRSHLYNTWKKIEGDL